MNPKNHGLIVMAANSFDISLILKATKVLDLNQDNIFTLTNGRVIMCLKLKEYEITIINSENYFNLDILGLNAMYSVIPTEDIISIPFRWCHNGMYDHVGQFPNLEDFVSPGMKENENASILLFFEKNKCQKHYNFRKELKLFSKQQTLILLKSCLLFLDNGLRLQAHFLHLGHTLKGGKSDCQFLHCYSQKIISITSFYWNLFMLWCLDKPIYALPREFENRGNLSSKGELEWVAWEMSLQPNRTYVNLMACGKQYFGGKGCATPDSFSVEDGEALFYHGCRVHGHMKPECTKYNLQLTDLTWPKRITVEEAIADFDTKLKKLLLCGEVKSVRIMWECGWQKIKLNNLDVRKFLESNHIHDGFRLNPRNLIRGGRTDCVRLNFSKETHDGSLFHYIDKNAFYASIAMDEGCQVPIGKHEYLFRQDSRRVKIIQNTAEANILIDQAPFMGAMKCVILVPRDDAFVRFVPILQTKCRGKIVVSLCHQCSLDKNIGTCNHSDMLRGFAGDYLSDELIFALKHKYVLLFWWEIICYKQTYNIFTKFMKVLAKERLAAQGKKGT